MCALGRRYARSPLAGLSWAVREPPLPSVDTVDHGEASHQDTMMGGAFANAPTGASVVILEGR